MPNVYLNKEDLNEILIALEINIEHTENDLTESGDDLEMYNKLIKQRNNIIKVLEKIKRKWINP